jgi:hypothetical protein
MFPERRGVWAWFCGLVSSRHRAWRDQARSRQTIGTASIAMTASCQLSANSGPRSRQVQAQAHALDHG